jgi:uncharacterized protein (TIGR02266 family)
MNERKPQQPAASSQGDHRRSLRKPLIVLKVKLDSGGRSFFGYAKNISRSGLFIATVSPREPGDRFAVEFTLPAPLDLLLNCTCEVVWKRSFSPTSPYEPGMGLKFLDLPEADAAAIDRWVQEESGKEKKG